MSTPNFGLYELTEAQGLKYVTINNNVNLIDIFLNPVVINQTTTVAPGSPSKGDCYIVAVGATGIWAGKDLDLACFVNGAWFYVSRFNGLSVFDLSLGSQFTYISSSWNIVAGAIRRTIKLHPDVFIADSGPSKSLVSFTNFSANVWDFLFNADEYITTTFNLPKHASYEDLSLRLYWTVPANSTGDCVWNYTFFEAEENDDLTVDPSTVAAIKIQSGPLNSGILRVTTFDNFDLSSTTDENALLALKIGHLGAHVSDNINQDPRFLSAVLEYAEKPIKDAAW